MNSTGSNENTYPARPDAETSAPRRPTRSLPAAAGALLLAAALCALAGCGGSSGTENSSAAGRAGGAAAASQGSGAAAGAGPADGKSAPQSGASASATALPGPGGGRQIVYTAELQVVAGDANAAVARAERLTQAAGGYVDEESAGSGGVDGGVDGGVQPQSSEAGGSEAGTGTGQAQPSMPLPEPTASALKDSARLVLRVPAASFDSVYHRLAGLGTVLGQERSADDATAQVADVNSRVASARTAVQRIRQLMDRAQSISDLTQLESVLTQRESDLESLEAQQKALQDQVAMSTLTLEVYQRETAGASTNGKGSGVGGSLAGGWHAFASTVRWIVSALATALPFLGVAVLVAAFWFWRRRRGAPEAPEAPEEAEASEASADGPSTGAAP